MVFFSPAVWGQDILAAGKMQWKAPSSKAAIVTSCSEETCKFNAVSIHMLHIAQEICAMARSEHSHMRPVTFFVAWWFPSALLISKKVTIQFERVQNTEGGAVTQE